jgi:DNA replication protein DnaC
MTDFQMLDDKLRRLGLSGMAKSLSIRVHEAETGEVPYQTFLDSLITDELNKRVSRLHDRRLKLARFPFLKTMENFDFDFNSSIKKREVTDLMTGRCLIEGRNVLLIGPPGVGKTHIATALGISAVEKGYEVFYRSIFDFLEEISLAISKGKRAEFMKKMIKVPLLIIDEFGMKKIPSPLNEDILELLYRRYGCRSTVICTNRPIEDWGKILGDVPAASAILDRFLEGVNYFKITGKGYRLQGKKNDSFTNQQKKDKSTT